jgi:hypothetical protein
LFQNSIDIFALAEGKYGGFSEDSNAPWQGQYSGVAKFWDNDDPIYLAGRLNSGPFRDLTVDEIYRGDYWKLREVGVRYQLPESLVARAGVDRASISFSGRGLWTIWQRHESVGGVAIADPENGSTLENNGNNYYVTPPSSSINVTMRVSF